MTRRPGLERDAALLELARLYFGTRGPATIDDFAWWSGLTKSDSKRAVDIAGGDLESRSIDGRSYWVGASAPRKRFFAPLAHLLPNYDEYIVGFKDRSAFGVRLRAAGKKPMTTALAGHALVVNGQIVGGWMRRLTSRAVVLEPQSLVRLTKPERGAIESAAQRFGAFLGAPAEIRWR